METILKLSDFIQEHKGAVNLVVGLVLGILLGLAVGWWWWPVEWTNSTPGNLRWDFQNEYLVWVAGQYEERSDVAWAYDRLGVPFWKQDQLSEKLAQLEQECEQGQWDECTNTDAMRLRAMAEGLRTYEPVDVQLQQDGNLTFLERAARVCGVALLALVVVGGAFIVYGRLRESQAPQPAEGGALVRRSPESATVAEQASWGDLGPPLTQFTSSYALGDDHFDPSFSIELENGDFMGECGVGISETIGVGEPNKVTALEVWLFDKSDIRTVTKVMMSDYAYHDEALHTKLAPKGEPVLVEPGKEVMLETKTLRVRVRIVEGVYGMGNLPPNSFFERLTVELAAWVKPEKEWGKFTTGGQAVVMPPTL